MFCCLREAKLTGHHKTSALVGTYCSVIHVYRNVLLELKPVKIHLVQELNLDCVSIHHESAILYFIQVKLICKLDKLCSNRKKQFSAHGIVKL